MSEGEKLATAAVRWCERWESLVRARGLLGVVVVAALTASGCDWSMFRFSPDHPASSPDTSITMSAAARLAVGWTATTGGAVGSSPAVANGVVYVGSGDGKVYALDAAGNTNCSGSPKSCGPLWTATTGGAVGSSPAVAGGAVYVGSGDGKVYAFDAAGNTNCSGSPKSCGPLWTASTGGAVSSSPAVAGGAVYVGSGDGKVYAFDAAGNTNCSGSPKSCGPLWTASTGGAVSSSPAVANGVVYVGSGDAKIYAFDASGSTNCSGSPKSCGPLSTVGTGGAVSSSPAVSNGDVYVGSADGKVYATQPWVFQRPSCPANPNAGLDPCQIQDAYRLPSLATGTAQTVAIVDAFDDPNAEADLGVYRSTYGLPPCTTANGCFKKLNQNGQQSNYPSADSGWGLEISLDVAMVSATCPYCHIDLVEATSASFVNLTTAEDTAAALAPAAISNSYGGAEFSSETSYDSHFTHPGITITASTGDNGFGTSWPAVSPAVIAVGGTDLAADGGVPRGWDETAWSGAGSGCSTYEVRPSWQNDPACTNRTVADVSALAGSPGASVYDTYGHSGWSAVFGTSVAAPLIAGVSALAAPVTPSSSIYSHASSLFDITSGSNGSCGTNLCTAGPGYDGPTGLGTPCGTAAFGAGSFVTTDCPGAGVSPAVRVPEVPVQPVCGPVPPGYARCHVQVSKP